MSNRNQPVFIIGAERSGTTLLRLMLSSSRELCIPPESIFLTELYPKYKDGLTTFEQVPLFLDDLFSVFFFDQWELDREVIKHKILELGDLSYANIIEAVYHSYASLRDPEAVRWGDKNPIHTLRTDIILILFPNAQFVHIIRDGRDAVTSQKETQWGKQRSYEKATALWTRYVDAGNIFANQNPSQCIEIKYERLVLHPELVLQQICEFTGITYTERMLEFYKRNQAENMVPIEQQSYHSLTLEGVNSTRIERWRGTLEREDLEVIETIAGETLVRNGYLLETK